MNQNLTIVLFISIFLNLSLLNALSQTQVAPVVPSIVQLNAPFSSKDIQVFKNPSNVYHPETWFHYIGGNVSKEGITADLEAIAGAGISGIQLFHGQFGGPWPGVGTQIACLSPLWEDALQHTAEECRRLGLRFTMQNCPGWAMSGGPWIKPSNAMRNLVWTRMDVEEDHVNKILPVPQPSLEEWRDYKDIAVLAFPTPLDDTGKILRPLSVKGDTLLPWKGFLSGETRDAFKLKPSTAEKPHWVEVTFQEAVVLRTIEFSTVEGFNHAWCYAPGVEVMVQAIFPNGATQQILQAPMPQAAWQSNHPISLACNETVGTKTYRIQIVNLHDMNLRSLRLFSAARKNNWESEAAWTLRSIVRSSEHPKQSTQAFIKSENILDISSFMDQTGNLNWKAPQGKWTILRIGHVNAGQKNGPAPVEGTGWECDKLSESGAKAHFAGYIGHLNNGPLKGGLLNGMLMDSWECYTQTWTPEMESEFRNQTGYELKRWFPALFGYVVNDQQLTSRFLLDWRGVIGDLFANRFYGAMSKLAKENGLNIIYETAAGDVFPADIMEYYKFADVPMCEFWHPYSDSYVGSINFKPIKPTVSAARLYGKPRISAEAFTSFELSWDEHLSMLKEVANLNFVEGVTHLVFHTYTHNPRTDFLPPGTSFGSGIGTPFLRGQTWWQHMPEFTTYLSRLNYLFERGKPVSDVLWYLGDEINHKPDQEAPFPKGVKYDYCNPDVLLNRLSVRDGKIVTPEGISYRLIWLPDNERMLPETLEKLLLLVREGAIVVGNAPLSLATLKGGGKAQERFESAVKELWGNRDENIRVIGKGKILSGITLDAALKQLNMTPDVICRDALWLHRQVDGADWYYVCAPHGNGLSESVSFRNTGNVEIWDPLTGSATSAQAIQSGHYTNVSLDLPRAGSCFVVFRKNGKASKAIANSDSGKQPHKIALAMPWKLDFPSGWGAPSSIQVNELRAWKDLDLTPEAKSFSGTATYTTTFDAGNIKKNTRIWLDLGRVEMIAVVSLNDKPIRTLWTPPYKVDLTGAVNSGINKLSVQVTSTWFNRLVFDAGQPEGQRKTWTIKGPSKEAALRESGLIGPVMLYTLQ